MSRTVSVEPLLCPGQQHLCHMRPEPGSVAQSCWVTRDRQHSVCNARPTVRQLRARTAILRSLCDEPIES